MRDCAASRGTNAEHETFTGAPGEITVDTTANTLHVHDGQTPGGTTLAKQNEIPTNIQIANIAMPSDKYIDLAFGATETEYTALADGNFVMSRKLIPRAHLAICNTVIGLGTTAYFYGPSGNNRWLCVCARPSRGHR